MQERAVTEGEESVRTATPVAPPAVGVDSQFVQHVLLQAANDAVALHPRELAFSRADVVHGRPVLHLVAKGRGRSEHAFSRADVVRGGLVLHLVAMID